MTTPELPIELVEEILSFVPATSLKRLRLTCKRWNCLIKDNGIFARKNFDKAAKQFEILIFTKGYGICPLRVNLHGSNPSVEVKSELRLVDPHSKYSVKIDVEAGISHCEGLLLCINRHDLRMLIWNPLTGETSRRINIHKEFRSFCLGYSNKSCNKSYKILSYNSQPDDSSSNDFEIYEFESDSWRVVVNDDDDINAPGGWQLDSFRNSVSLKGNIYMFAFDNTETPSSLSLLKFDFSTEKSLLVPLPYKCHKFETTSLCVVREEKLSVLLQREREGKVEIWVTNKIDEVGLWSKFLALDLIPDFRLYDDITFILDEEKKVFIFIDQIEEIRNKYKDVLYIVGEDNKPTILDAGIDPYSISCPGILDYVPSLVHIDQAM